MKLANVPIVLAVLAALVLVASGYGTQFGVWDFRFGFTLLRWSLYAGLVAAAVAVIALVIPRARAGRGWSLVAALVIGLGVAYFPFHWQQVARAVPPINDITTDTANPPAFVAVLPLRAGAPVSADYPGAETAAQQQRGYPDIRPVDLSVPPDAAFARALDTAKGFGWLIDATDPASGRIEATATTPWFGFKDDVVIRVTPTASGSRVDIRSHSRVGRSDLGANAKRIREFVAKLTA
ncbi:MAG TPA: DUF1499 domain-containing protein [Casimicrobiaceae bacterium]|nr:DUF1499 domain-containing protein [Casimicrobiaceae bacterium]